MQLLSRDGTGTDAGRSETYLSLSLLVPSTPDVAATIHTFPLTTTHPLSHLCPTFVDKQSNSAS